MPTRRRGRALVSSSHVAGHVMEGFPPLGKSINRRGGRDTGRRRDRDCGFRETVGTAKCLYAATRRVICSFNTNILYCCFITFIITIIK